MPMPTTRRGRFLFYKQRQRRRLRRAYQKHDKLWGSLGIFGVRTTNRYRLYEGFTLQMPRVYPQHFPEKSNTAEQWESWGWTPPARGRWGVVRLGVFTEPNPDPVYAGNEAWVGYYDRRLKSIPRLKHLEWSGRHAEVDRDDIRCYYPLPTYPSGRPSYAAIRWGV